MGNTYRNNLGPWRRSGFEIVPSGGTFVATEKEEARIARRPEYQARFELIKTAVPSEPADKVLDDAANKDTNTQVTVPTGSDTSGTLSQEPGKEPETKTEDVLTWPLKTSPEDYLKSSPGGPKAELARKILESRPATAE